MAINVKHAFISGKTDDVDATVVRASNWNENHTLTMTTNKLLGRGTAADGAVEEITLGTNLALSGTTLNATGASVSAASRLIGRGSASGAGAQEEITLGTNISMSGTTLNVALGGGVAAVITPQGRLTLQTAVPVMTTSQSAKTTIYYTPYCGNQIGLYDGSSVVVTTFAELSNLTAQSSTGKAGPAVVGASSVYDLFVWSDAGTVRLTRGPAWTNDTTRSAGTALVMVAGLLLNNATITNGPAASRGTYVGTVRSNASSQIDWINGGSGSGGVRGVYYVWNMYNRCAVQSTVTDTTVSEAYNTATWKIYLNGANNAVDFVSGLAEDACSATASCRTFTDANVSVIGIGYDSTSSPAAGLYGSSGGVGTNVISPSTYYSTTALGKHTVNFIEKGNTNAVFYGDDGSVHRGGLIFQFLM